MQISTIALVAFLREAASCTTIGLESLTEML